MGVLERRTSPVRQTSPVPRQTDMLRSSNYDFTGARLYKKRISSSSSADPHHVRSKNARDRDERVCGLLLSIRSIDQSLLVHMYISLGSPSDVFFVTANRSRRERPETGWIKPANERTPAPRSTLLRRHDDPRPSALEDVVGRYRPLTEHCRTKTGREGQTDPRPAHSTISMKISISCICLENFQACTRSCASGTSKGNSRVHRYEQDLFSLSFPVGGECEGAHRSTGSLMVICCPHEV